MIQPTKSFMNVCFTVGISLFCPDFYAEVKSRHRFETQVEVLRRAKSIDAVIRCDMEL